MSKITAKIKKLLPSKRRLIQLYAALLFNANIKGFFNGQIYKGPLKNVCTPGLNCYSCPGASGACPLGALQNSLSASTKTIPFYVFGIIILYGLIFGRFICGFLCPFGLIQELFHKIKTPKLKKGKITKILSYFKYVVLAVFVVIIPLIYAFKDFPLPAFCKYICPAGTLEGAIGLLVNPLNDSIFGMLGPLFTWKFVLLVCFIAACVFIFRFFCRFFCPLGAIYGFFNKISFIGVKVDQHKCTDCGQCVTKCKMDITKVADHECISCGECVDSCPAKAINWKGPRILIRDNEIESKTDEKSVKITKRRKAVRYTAAALAVAVLCGALVYYNFIDKPTEYTDGYNVGDLCYTADIPIVGETEEYFNVSENLGKITVINFWGTWCGPCKEELPHFDKVAKEYEGSVTVVTLHTEYLKDTASDYINEYFPDSKMVFCIDTNEEYHTKLGFGDVYPATLVVDREGVIVARIDGKVSYEDLVDIIEGSLK